MEENLARLEAKIDEFMTQRPNLCFGSKWRARRSYRARGGAARCAQQGASPLSR